MVTCENDVIKKGLILLENKDYDGAIGVFAGAEKLSRENNEGDRSEEHTSELQSPS